MAQKRLHLSYSGRKTFDFILSQIEDAFKDISPFFKNLQAEDIYKPDYLKHCQQYLIERPEIDLTQLALCDIAYSIIYFGASYPDLTTAGRLFEKKYSSVLISYISSFVTKKPHPDSIAFTNWGNFKKLYADVFVQMVDSDVKSNSLNNFKEYFNLERESDDLRALREYDYFKYYGGHQHKLGHYFRHLYQTTKYINEQKILTYKEKYEYIKTLRAQLSTPEQYILFFNSIATMGREWELEKSLDTFNSQTANNYLITKYNLIKNIPDTYFMNEIQITNYYPFVHFEFEDCPKQRMKFENLFK